MSPEELKKTVQCAQEMIADGKEKDAMPVSLIPPGTSDKLVGFPRGESRNCKPPALPEPY